MVPSFVSVSASVISPTQSFHTLPLGRTNQRFRRKLKPTPCCKTSVCSSRSGFLSLVVLLVCLPYWWLVPPLCCLLGQLLCSCSAPRLLFIGFAIGWFIGSFGFTVYCRCPPVLWLHLLLRPLPVSCSILLLVIPIDWGFHAWCLVSCWLYLLPPVSSSFLLSFPWLIFPNFGFHCYCRYPLVSQLGVCSSQLFFTATAAIHWPFSWASVRVTLRISVWSLHMVFTFWFSSLVVPLVCLSYWYWFRCSVDSSVSCLVPVELPDRFLLFLPLVYFSVPLVSLVYLRCSPVSLVVSSAATVAGSFSILLLVIPLVGL